MMIYIFHFLIFKQYTLYYIMKKCEMTESDFWLWLNKYRNYNNFVKKLKTKYTCRLPLFPGDLSEYIALLCCKRKLKQIANLSSPGDIICGNKRIEVKAFLNVNTPISFGPKQQWDSIIFVDATDYMNYNFKVYHLCISNINTKWKNLKINKMLVKKYNTKSKKIMTNFTYLKKSFKYHMKIIYNGTLKFYKNKVILKKNRG